LISTIEAEVYLTFWAAIVPAAYVFPGESKKKDIETSVNGGLVESGRLRGCYSLRR
jgi:hypothetical protein